METSSSNSDAARGPRTSPATLPPELDRTFGVFAGRPSGDNRNDKSRGSSRSPPLWVSSPFWLENDAGGNAKPALCDKKGARQSGGCRAAPPHSSFTQKRSAPVSSMNGERRSSSSCSPSSITGPPPIKTSWETVSRSRPPGRRLSYTCVPSWKPR